MNALALLCNLHGEGPLTLRRLRRAGIRRIEHVQGLDETRLGEIVAFDPGRTERFLREAALLRERVGLDDDLGEVDLLLPRPKGELLASLETEAHGAFFGSDTRNPFEPASGPEASGQSFDADESAAAALDPRLTSCAATREPGDDGDGGDGTRPGAKTDERPADSTRGSGAEAAAERTPLLAAEGTRLTERLALPGLDAALCRRLVTVGILTLEALVEHTGPGLARRLGIPYPELLALSYHARHYDGDVLHPTPPPPRTDRDVGAPPASAPVLPRAFPSTTDVSGPFV